MEYHFLHVMINNPPLECIYDVRTNISKIWADYYFQSVTLTNGTGCFTLSNYVYIKGKYVRKGY